MTLEMSNYWDDFEQRVKETCAALEKGELPPLRRLTVHLTQGCNLQCAYCNMENAPRTIDEDLTYKIIEEYKEIGGQTIHFTGGEPTIVPFFLDICEYAKDIGLVTSANTNAVKRVDTTNIDKLKASFDVTDRKEYAEIVGVDCFDKVVENLKHYSESMKGKMLSITAVVDKTTFRGMLDLAEFVYDNFEVYNLYFSSYKGFNKERTLSEVEVEELFMIHIPDTLNFFKKVGADYSYKQLALYKPGDFADTRNRFEYVPCSIQLSEMTIDVDGVCHNCSHLYRDGDREYISVLCSPLGECFKMLKQNVRWENCISENCLSGCNTNLMGFNRAIQEKMCVRV